MFNPWLVDTIEAFSFYCCPECTFRTNEVPFFQVHALQNHALSKSFFNNFNLEEDTYFNNDNLEALEPKVDIKLEADDYEEILQDENHAGVQGLTQIPTI